MWESLGGMWGVSVCFRKGKIGFLEVGEGCGGGGLLVLLKGV